MGDVLTRLQNKDTPVVTWSAHFSDSPNPFRSATRSKDEREAGRMYGIYDGLMVVDREISANRMVNKACRGICT